MTLSKGDSGKEVLKIQEFLKSYEPIGLLGQDPSTFNFKEVELDGFFGHETEKAVKAFQKLNGLLDDGVIGPKTLSLMQLASTDKSEVFQSVKADSLQINQYHLPANEYLPATGQKKRWIFLHHTAGGPNPYQTIDGWKNDTRGPIATQYVMGGTSIQGNTEYDGVVVEAFPKGCSGWHLGNVGSRDLHINSVGIEICNMGAVTNGKTYVGSNVIPAQIVNCEFRGFTQWHKYSDNQIKTLRNLLIHIGKAEGIDLQEGLPKMIRRSGIKAFEFSQDAFSGKVFGILSHTNVRKDKIDVSPQQELIDMLLSL